MPRGLRRYHESGQSHFITFSCYRRKPKFADTRVYDLFPLCLEAMRLRFRMRIYGYVVMPEQPPQRVRKEALVGGPGKTCICWSASPNTAP